MKLIKTIAALCVATVISLNISAQAAATPAAKPATTQTKPAEKPAVSATNPEKPGAGDKVNKDLKGRNGEVVYTGPKGGNYFINKNTGKKEYLPKATTTPAK